MAALRRSRLSNLLANFANTLANHASNFNKAQQTLFHCSSLLFVKGQEIKMPSLSPTMNEGKIIKWLKKEGDAINPGDVLCDIETDKAIVSMEIEEEGILAKIIVPENSAKVNVGSLIALMVYQGEDWKNVELSAGVGVSSSDSESSDSSSSSSSSDELEIENGDQEAIITGPSAAPIKMPSLSPTMTAGTIVKWLKKEGDTIAPGDVLCDIQTDKAIMSMEAEEEGILAKILIPDDSKDVKVGTLIAVMVPEGEDWKSVAVTMKSLAKKREMSQTSEGFQTSENAELRGKSFGPAVKALLAAYQLKPDLIKPTGRGNRLLKEDVLKYINDSNLNKKPPKAVSAPAPIKSILKSAVPHKKSEVSSTGAAKYKDIELSSMRQTIAKRLMQSKQEIPHFYSVAKCNVDNLMKAKETLFSDGIKVSINDFLIKAVALSLQMYPKANALCINDEVKMSETVDVCVAVATDMGLYTPIVKTANVKNIVSISEEVGKLVAKAKNGKLKPEEFQGGTFTISNLGMFGITQFKAIINPPQCGILAVGSTIESLNSDMEIKKHMILSLSSDRRVLQENEAAEFMEVIKYFIENPKLITLDVNQLLGMRL